MITTGLNAIGRLGPATDGSPAGAAALAGGAGVSATSFGGVLGEVVSQAVGALQNSEAVSINAIQGKADTREAVDAVMSAEQSLQAAISIRDKIVASYLEISRMAI